MIIKIYKQEILSLKLKLDDAKREEEVLNGLIIDWEITAIV